MRYVFCLVSLLVEFAFAVPSTGSDLIELADPDIPAEVVANVAYSTLTVQGADRSDVEVEFRFKDDGKLGTLHIPILANGNRIEILHPTNSTPVEIRIEVPRRSHLTLESSNGGPIEVAGVEGEIEIVNSNAAVSLTAVRGSAVVSTSNAAISAEFTWVDPSAGVFLITNNNRIDVTLPPAFEGRVLAETDTGLIEIDFDIEPDRAPRSALRRPGRVLSGRIGGGGPLVRLRTENAGIHIAKAREE